MESEIKAIIDKVDPIIIKLLSINMKKIIFFCISFNISFY